MYSSLSAPCGPNLAFGRRKLASPFKGTNIGLNDNVWLTSFFHFTLRGQYLLLFDTRGGWIEATELLGFLPRKHAVCSGFILRRWHSILVDYREIREIYSCSRRACIDDLRPESDRIRIKK
jgi:hypothetical protein